MNYKIITNTSTKNNGVLKNLSKGLFVALILTIEGLIALQSCKRNEINTKYNLNNATLKPKILGTGIEFTSINLHLVVLTLGVYEVTMSGYSVGNFGHQQ